MAILKNLLVTGGASRFLGPIYCQDISVSDTATLSSLSLSGSLSVGGNATVSGTLGVTGEATFSNVTVFSKVGQSTAAWNNPALVVGGTADQKHLELCNDTIQGKSNKNTTSHLYLNYYGSNVYLAGSKIYAIRDSTFVAPTANIVTVNAQNVNVTNNLRAAHYDLQTVAQLGGSFYVSPTVKFPNSGTTLKVEKSGSTLTLIITDSSITSTTMAGVVWAANSHVKVSGTINGVVTGTMDGTVSSINTSSHVLTLSVSGENSANVVAGTYTASQFSDLTVMIYQRRDGSNDYCVGIWMNCYDLVNSSSTIRIYGGSSASPNVMLGNLTSAGLGTVNNLTPTGWGLFAQNAFLHGKVVANGGLIGNWNIGTTGMYYNSDAPSSTSITMIPGGTTASSTSIGGSSGSKQWIFTGKNLFGIDTDGKLYASSAEVSGKITATSGAIGGFDINSTAIKTKDVAVTSNADNSISLSSADFTRTINGTSRAGLRFAIGDKFGVTGDGAIYASSATISGNITASTGTIGGITAHSSYGLYTNSKTTATSTKTGFLIAKGGAIYLGAYDSTTGVCPFQVTNTGVLNAVNAILGNPKGYHSTVSGTAFEVYSGEAASTKVASFGSTATIGNMSSGVGFQITATGNDAGMKFNNGGTQAFFVGVNTRYETTTANSSWYTISSSSTTTTINGQVYCYVCDVPSGTTIVGVKGKDPDGTKDGMEQAVTDYSDEKFLKWTVSSNKFYVYTAVMDYDWDSWSQQVQYVYLTQSSTSIVEPYCVIGTSGYSTNVIPGKYSLAQGNSCIATGNNAVAFGSGTKATGNSSFASGENAVASGNYTTAIGYNSTASGIYSHSEGCYTIASNKSSHAEGASTTASGNYSHAEGDGTTASGLASHAEGNDTIASGNYSHAEGYSTTASGKYSHAGGIKTKVSGVCSYAEGYYITVSSDYNTVIGKYNKTGNYAFSIGNGANNNSRSNALTVDWNGNLKVSGDPPIKRVLVYSGNVTISGTGTNISFTLPTDFAKSYGVVISRAWPHSNWNSGAVVSMAYDPTFENASYVTLTTTSTQTYALNLYLLYQSKI